MRLFEGHIFRKALYGLYTWLKVPVGEVSTELFQDYLLLGLYL